MNATDIEAAIAADTALIKAAYDRILKNVVNSDVVFNLNPIQNDSSLLSTCFRALNDVALFATIRNNEVAAANPPPVDPPVDPNPPEDPPTDPIAEGS